MTNKFKPPERDEVVHLIEEISKLAVKVSLLDVEIKAREAEAVQIVTTDKKFWIDGKVPSMSYINNTYKILGLNGELAEKRKEYAEAKADLDTRKLYFEGLKLLTDVWRTESANERMF